MQEQATLAQTYEAAYARLNEAQRRAVATIDGPVLVVAGPGTGKTQILTLRIATILRQTDTPPESILALTFTESGAAAMRNRLRSFIGAAAYRVSMQTFHGFCERLIREYPDAYDRVIGGRPVSDLEQVSIMEDLLQSLQLKHLRPSGNRQFYVKPVLQAINQLKQENITPDRFAEIVASEEAALAALDQYHTSGARAGIERADYRAAVKTYERYTELLLVYRQYEAALAERSIYDFSDMILETVRALSTNEDMLRDLQERYLYVLADEHQDVNGAQNRILELLASFHERPNLFAVGDEKQAIYRFQGASLENFLAFTQAFPDTVTIDLRENYRSGQQILDTAQDLIAVEADDPLAPLRVPLTAMTEESGVVTLRTFSHQAIEEQWLPQAVGEALAQGHAPGEVAIIVRTNREVEAIAASLRAKHIPAAATADGDILSHPITLSVMELLRAVTHPTDEEALFALVHAAYWQISPSDLYRVLAARRSHEPLSALLADPQRLLALGVTDPTTVHRVHTVLQAARAKLSSTAPQQLLAWLLEESGLATEIQQEAQVESMRVLRRLYDEVEVLVMESSHATLHDVVVAMQQRRAYGLPLTAPYLTLGEQAVQVMTAHKAKGLEFAVVFIPFVVDSVWGGRSKPSSITLPNILTQQIAPTEALEDERRLLYVAMTRAKQALHLSYSAENQAGRELVPSRLLESIDPTRWERPSVQEFEAAFNPLAVVTAQASHRSSVSLELLIELVRTRGFSATSFNNYSESPWNYIYRNLLRIPEPQAFHLLYGTAVHNTLEAMTKQYTHSGTLPSLGEVDQLIKRELAQLPLSVQESADAHERALTELSLYREHLSAHLPAKTSEEFLIQVTFPTGIPELPELPLTGKLDRLDFNEAGQLVQVVDYKTGKPKSRNEILGNTKNSDGRYHQQLVFYALLLELYGDARYQSRTMTLSFVQPRPSGKIAEEQFVIADEAVTELKSQLITAAQAFVSGSILEIPCDPDSSPYCELVTRLTRPTE
ncbi:MAG: ATP-dependent helicase [Patescibacteria group bacterium]